jgi:hypothetical protein
MMVKSFILAVVCGGLLCSAAAAQEQDAQPQGAAVETQNTEPIPSVSSGEYKIDASEIKKKPYHFGGFAEFRPVINGLNKDSAFYKLNFYNQKEGGTLQEYNSMFQPDFTLEKGSTRLYLQGNIGQNHTYQGWSNDSRLYQGYLTLKPSNSWIFDMGKKTFKWGKGYAWNPVAFLDRPKDPTDPDLALEGYWAASAQYLRSFHGRLKTFSFTSVLLPVFYNVYGNNGVNNSFVGSQSNLSGGSSQVPPNQVNAVEKAYFLLYDTDIDFTFFKGQTKTTRYGLDFSRNIGTKVEVHGELAAIKDFQKNVIDSSGLPHSSTYNALNYLLGTRYLSSKLTTYLLEYYRNGTGLTTGQMQDYFSYVDKGYSTYLSTGKAASIQKASNMSSNYGRNSPMQNYLYLRISQDQPFGRLYYTPVISSIMNLNDGSFQVIPELVCTRITNWELRFRTYVPVGSKNTEFGEKQNNYRVEFRVRRFF